MKAILLTLIVAATSSAQGLVPVLPVPGQAEIVWPAQYYGGYCQPPQCYPPQGWQPARPPQTTPPVGSDGTPQFTPRPPNGTPAKPVKECDCGPKWEALAKWQQELDERTENVESLAEVLRLELAKFIKHQDAQGSPQTQQQIQTQIQEGISQYFSENPAAVENIAQQVADKLPPITFDYLDSSGSVAVSEPVHLGEHLPIHPFSIRIEDPRGPLYSTEYQEVQPWKKQYVTLPFGPHSPLAE